MLEILSLLLLFIELVTSTELSKSTASGWGSPDCSYTSIGTVGEIISPVTRTDTKEDIYCEWRITSPKNTHISLEFSSFNIFYEESCRWGYVEIYFGNDTSYLKVDGKKLCGNISNSDGWTFKTNSVLVFYYGNARKLYQGFKLVWTSSEAGPTNRFNTCGEQHILPEFVTKMVKTITGELTPEEFLYTNASEGSWPWHAILNEEGENYSKVCQATILSRGVVITAAHCIEHFVTKGNKLRSNLFVFVGKHLASTWEATEQKIRVERIHIHKDRLFSRYLTLDNEISDNDLALLELENNIKYSPYVRPACFPQSTKRGNVCIATGWNIQYAINTFSEGMIKFGKAAGLKELEIKFYDDYVCDLLLAAEQHIQSEDHNFLCGTSDSLKSPTWATLESGDSGGPLVCYQNGHWELVGVSVAILQYGSIGKIVHLFMKVDNNWVREKLGLQRNFWDTDILWN